MIRDPEQLQALVDGVDRFVRDRLLPAEAIVEETDDIPADIIEDMRQLGLFGLSVPEEYGGLGLTTEEEAHVIMALSWASPAYRSLIGTTVGIGSQGIVIDGTPEQKAVLLPQLASGGKIAYFSMPEPDDGSYAGAMHPPTAT